MTDPTIHIGATRRIRHRDGSHTDYTINLSGIPATSGDHLITAMMGRAQAGLDAILTEIEDRIHPRVSISAFELETKTIVNAIEEKAEILAAAIKATTELTEHVNQKFIPKAEEVYDYGHAFGISIPFPRYDWLQEVISTEDGHDQRKALNAGLTKAGFGGKMRHRACLAILKEYGNIHDQAARSVLETLNSLSRAEAHICLAWLEQANQYNFAAMSKAAGFPAQEVLHV